MLRGVQAPGVSPGDSPLKTHPRQRSIHKLLDAVAHGGNPQDRAASLFAIVADSLFPIAHRYSIRKPDLTSWLRDFTCSSPPEQNPRSLVFEVLNADLVFVRGCHLNLVQVLESPVCKTIVQKFKALIYEDLMSKLLSCRACSQPHSILWSGYSRKLL